MFFRDLVPPYIQALTPYRPGKPIADLERELGLVDVVKLASNESPLGPSPLALAAIENTFLALARYPDGNGYALKAVLAERLGVAVEQVVLGNGSNDVLEMVARTFLGRDSSAVYSQHAFALYPLIIQAVGARGIVALADGYGHSLADMLAAVDSDTRVVFIANPNNPTGTLLSAEALLDFLTRLPATVLVVLDEAYYEYLAPAVRGDAIGWLGRFPNLVVIRTFSKAYGLAGLRGGYAVVDPAVAQLLNQVRQPFNVNSLAQAAAIAALDDAAHLDQALAVNVAGMAQLTAGLRALGLDFIHSHGNFVSYRVGDADAIYRSLLRRGVIVRPVANYGLPEFLRVSIGLKDENAKFLQALEQGLEELR